MARTAAASDTFRATRRPSCVSAACQTSPVPPQLSQALDHLGLHAHQRTVGATVDDLEPQQPLTETDEHEQQVKRQQGFNDRAVVSGCRPAVR